MIGRRPGPPVDAWGRPLPAEIECRICGFEGPPSPRGRCPYCGARDVRPVERSGLIRIA